MKRVLQLTALLAVMLVLRGCGIDGQKTANLTVAYGAMAVLSFLLLISCGYIVRKKDTWLLVLFTSVLIVNTGYFMLSISKTLEQALWANRLAYLGSVFLPLAMLMIMLRVTGVRFSKWLPIGLVVLGICVFFVAASPGYLDIYYREVSMQVVGGVCVLQKVYGPWHILYLFYLLGYFVAMVTVVIQTAKRKDLGSPVPAVILALAVFANIGVWLIEQMVNIQFEILSVSYIISELFLLGLHMIVQENSSLQERVSQLHKEAALEGANPQIEEAPQFSKTMCQQFQEGVLSLTKTEHAIFDCYIAGKTTKDILTDLNIKENTLKFHNKNIYGKLGVNSRKQLVEVYRMIQRNNP